MDRLVAIFRRLTIVLYCISIVAALGLVGVGIFIAEEAYEPFYAIIIFIGVGFFIWIIGVVLYWIVLGRFPWPFSKLSRSKPTQ